VNSNINWIDPSNTSAVLDGQSYSYNALSAEAQLLNVSSVTGSQFMDIVILHELAHFSSTIGNPDNATVEQQLWNDCVKN